VYKACYTQQFRRSTKKADQKALKEACEEILADPYNARDSHRLRYDWAGFRAATFTGPDRIIFRVCEECVRLREQKVRPLGCCEQESPDNAIVTFVDFGDYHSGKRRLLPTKRYTVES
jgi:mRNA-degrading endonuclease YafQ of YafQ-DinJ toxin-antitoxin module